MSECSKTSPDSWPEQRLGDLFRINGDQLIPMSSSKVEFVHYSIPAWDATGGPLIELGSQIESNKTAIRSPAVLVSKLNPRKPRTVAVPSPSERTCCSTEFICYQPKQSSHNLKFWSAYFASAEFSARLARVAVGSTNSHTRAAPKETLEWIIPNVPVAQQDTIAQILDTLDTAIQETEALIAKLKAVKQGLLHDLLTRGIDANGELRPPQSEAPELYKMSALGWIPREWDIESLTQVCSEIVDCPHSTPQYQDQGVLVARTMHIKDGVFLESQASRVSESQYQGRIARLKPLAGDLILTREAPVGEAFVIPLGMKICLGQRVMLLRPSNGELIADYLLAQIYSGAVKDRIAALTSGTTNPHLNVSEVKSFEIPLPGIEEQQRISEQLKSIDLRISVELQQLQKLGKEKSGLMDDLLTGRVRVTPLLPAHAEESP